jgi:hypothetical protein
MFSALSVAIPGNIEQLFNTLNAVASYASGDELERISVRDFQRYDDSGVNWR